MISFGNVDVLPGTAVDVTATITVSCSGGAGAGQRLCISIGAGSAGDATSRQLQLGGSGPATLRYDLYSNSSRTTLWGSWQTGYDTAGVQVDVAQNSTTPVTVYARLFGSQQAATTGAYSSTFTANPFLQYGNLGGSSCPTGNLTTSTSTSASATVVTNCNISATNLSFGTVGLLTANIDATTTMAVQCNSATPYTVGLDNGHNFFGTRRMKDTGAGTTFVNYGLYTDSARTLGWTTTTSPSSCTGGANTCASGTGTGSNQTITVYGRIPSQTTPAPATFNDTIVATVTY
jgi:spore coat protein U domain-containing protein, fimbrial subunit CupE1/2/3/6